jgi:hypothetical protein
MGATKQELLDLADFWQARGDMAEARRLRESAEDMDDDITRDKAERLVRALKALGLPAILHWDRSPWCAKVYLQSRTGGERGEFEPAIFFMLEESDSYRIKPASEVGHSIHSDNERGWRWQGQLGGLEQFDLGDDQYELGFHLLERTWLGDTERDVALKVRALLTLFKDPADLPLLNQEDD